MNQKDSEFQRKRVRLSGTSRGEFPKRQQNLGGMLQHIVGRFIMMLQLDGGLYTLLALCGSSNIGKEVVKVRNDDLVERAQSQATASLATVRKQ